MNALKQMNIVLIIVSLISISCHKSNDLVPDTIITSRLPDTGQTTSYTATPGEDADFTINPPSYTDNENGTISDNVTGLMWQKTDGGEMIFENAATYCTTLNLGGYNDWRLPKGSELFGINSFDKLNPALNTTFFVKTAAEYWWTSETRADAASNVWVVNAGGGIGAHPKTETISAGGTKHFHVRAVRNTQQTSAINDHFKDNGDGTITDNYSGLMWQKVKATDLMTWEEALSYASGLSLSGKADWRLPNVKEIQSLNDPKLSKPSFDKNYFVNVLSGNFWSSTTLFNANSKAWDINIDYGIVSYNDKTLKENVLCVRGGTK
jgi:hypothetical protein